MTSLEHLSKSDHDREGFDCGVEALNDYLKNSARQAQERGLSSTFVLTEEGASSPKAILAYYTLSLCEVDQSGIPASYRRKLPPRPCGAVRLARLGVDTRQQGKGYGKTLIAAALRKFLFIHEQAGAIGLFVDAKDQAAASFYSRFGFERLEEDGLTLFMPLKTIQGSSKE